MTDLDIVCEKLGITLLPWQREFADAVLSGQPMLTVYRSRGWGRTAVQRVIEATKEEK